MTTKKKSSRISTTPATSADNANPDGITINLAAVLPQLQNPDPEVVKMAVQALEAAVEADPKNPLALHGLGIACAQKQEYERAFTLFERATLSDPKFAAPFSNLGNLHRLAGRDEEAMKAYRHALVLQPSLPDAHYSIAIMLEQEGKLDEAQESLKRALLFRPSYSEAHNNYGHLLLKSGKTEQAISHFRQALVWNPELKPARTNLILALYRVGRCTEANSEVEKALEQFPGEAAAILRTQAAGLAYQGLVEDAQGINLKILALEPDAADVQLNMGELLLAREDYEGALTCYRELLAKKNVHPALCISAMANVLLAQGNLSEARDLFRQGLMMEARLPTLTVGLGKTLLEAGEIALGIQTLRRATEMLPEAAEIHSLLIHALHLDPTISAGERADEMARWVARHGQKDGKEKTPSPARSRHGKGKLRAGFLLGDIGDAATAGCLEALFSNLDASRVDVHVYYSGGKMGANAKRLQKVVSRWRAISGMSGADLRERIREDDIEILVDTAGHNLGNRLQVCAEKSAPVQVTWLGDFSTTGLPEMDFVLTDETLVPTDVDESANAGPERPLCLPAVACHTPAENAPAPSPLPALSASHITFGAPSRLCFINAALLDAWADILTRVPASRLVIFSNTAAADEASRERLKKLFLLREIEIERVDVLPRLAEADYWKAIASLDMALDSFPFPLGPRAMDCLWMGVPVLTLAGASPYRRATLSFLKHAALPEWGASSQEEYVAKAVAFASNRDQLEQIRATLRDTLKGSLPLDGKAFANSFTLALESIRPKSASPTRKSKKPR